MTRRFLILVSFGTALWADDVSKAWELLGDAASALSQGNGVYFFSLCDKTSPEFETLRKNIAGLLETMDVQSSIDLVSNEGDATRRTIVVDWSLRLVPINRGSAPVQRRQNIKCVLEKRSRAWRIVSLDPVQFFALPKP